MRDARPFLQIAHIGPWNVAAPEALALVRARTNPFRKEPSRHADAASSTLRHDPTAVLALRQWLEAVALRDTVGRKLTTWLVETGSRTAYGDSASVDQARALARALAHGAQHARVLVAGRLDTRAALDANEPIDERALEVRFGASHPQAPLCLRAPHGAFEVQLVTQDTERVERAHALARTEGARAEFAPADRAPVLVLAAGHEHEQTAARVRGELGWVFSSTGSSSSVTASAAHVSARAGTGLGPEDAQRVALVRVYASASQRRAAIVERLLFSRPLAMGPFRLVQSQSTERLISWP